MPDLTNKKKQFSYQEREKRKKKHKQPKKYEKIR
jgi:hypothetical protein